MTTFQNSRSNLSPPGGFAARCTPARLRIVLVVLLSLTSLLTCVFILWQSLREYDTAIEEANRQLLGNVRSMSEHAWHSISETDRVLRGICKEIENGWETFSRDEKHLHDFLKNRTDGLRQIGTVMVANSEGNSMATAIRYPQKTVNIAERDYFMHHRQNVNSALYIGRPVLSKILDKMIFTLSRGFKKPDGSFGGVVIISFPIDYFEQFYRSVATRPDLQTALLRTDGLFLCAYPHDERAYSANVSGKELLGSRVQNYPFGVFRNRTALYDDADRQIGFSRLDAPYSNIVAVVAVSRDSVLGGWKQSLVMNTAAALLLLSVSLLLAYLLFNRLRQLEAAGEALRESEERWKFALEGSGDGIWDWDASTNRVFFSRQWKSMLGYADDEIGNDLSEWESRLHPEDISAVKTEFQRHLDGETPLYSSEHRLLCKDGSYKWILDRGMVVTRDSTGKPLRAVGTHADITARKQSEKEYKTLIETTMDGFWLNDLQGRILDVNDAYCRLVGYSRDELLSMSIPDLEAVERQEDTRAHIEKLLSSGYDRFETKHRHRDGHLLDVEVSANFLPVADGRLLAFVRDIGERKQAEIMLRKAKEEAEAASIAKSRFMAVMSHEIRTPMNAVQGMLHLLRNSQLDSRQEEYLATITEATSSLMAIINDILDLAKIEAGRLQLDISLFNLRQMTYSTISVLRPRAEEKQIALEIEFDIKIPEFVRGDHLRLGQILFNLVGNAIKFTEKGHVRFSVRLQESTDDTATVRFEVEDTGIGIAPEHQPGLFEPFAQADSSISRRFGGTGLGLSISSELARLMGSELRFASIPGQGSTFAFSVSFQRSDSSLEEKTVDQQASAAEKSVPVFDTELTLELKQNISPLFKELSALLEKQNMKATRRFEELQKKMGDCCREEQRAIYDSLQRLDFAGALRMLRKLAEKLGMP